MILSQLTHQRQYRKQSQIESSTQRTLRLMVNHLDDILDHSGYSFRIMAVWFAGFKTDNFAIVRDTRSHGDDLLLEHRA